LPHAVEIPARKKRRLEDPSLPLLTSTDEAASNTDTASAEITEGLSPPPAAMPPSADTVNASSRCQSSRQSQLPPIETSETQLDGDDDDDVNADPDADPTVGDLTGPS
jgi:hypothetical protein